MNINDVTLPELTDERLEAMETALFTRIAADRDDAVARAERSRVRAVRRGRIWMGGAAAAAIIAVAALIAPQLGGAGGSAVTLADQPMSVMDGADPLPQIEGMRSAEAGTGFTMDAQNEVAAQSTAGAERSVIATASATVRVADARAAADAIAAAVDGNGGYVESTSVTGADSRETTSDAVTTEGMVIYPGPAPTTGAWITVRIPSAQLTSTMDQLSEIGEVLSTQIDRSDVTTQTVDLRARVASLEASVARLTDLMAQATSTADLLAAESALSERQSELESLRQQLTWFDSQVEMSTLTVTLTEPDSAPVADPAGFGDGFAAGWHGLVAALNGVVIGLGFLLPWLGVSAVVVVIVWAVRRLMRRRGRAGHDSTEKAMAEDS